MDINKICAGCMNENEEGGVCPVCGCDADYTNSSEYLPVKYVLSGRYIIGKVISVSCESAIYIAYDSKENKTVNVKEYFPQSICERGEDFSLIAKEGRDTAFLSGGNMFKSLNEKLIDTDLPAIPKTFTVFGANGTVYVVTDAVTGITLKDFLNRNGGKLKWEQARPLFLPLIDTVNELNKQGIIHGGISPESIFIGRDGRLRLRDILINTARKANKDMAAQIYGGYAALEQYKSQETQLGGYTDVYGISATLFRVLIGNVPADAVKRAEKDSLSIPSHFAEELPRQVLVAMANGLQVLPENRTESMEKFRDELVYGEIETDDEKPKKSAKEDIVSSSDKKAEKTKAKASGKKGGNLKVALITAGCTVLFFLIIAAVLVFGVFKDDIFKKESSKKSVSDSEMPSVASIGDYDSSLVNSAETFTVPDLTGQTFAQITEKEEYKHFKFVIEKKVYSSKYAKGTVCEQSVKAGEEVEDETTVIVAISLGTQEFQISDVLGLTELEAKVQLLRQGILFDNIEVVEKYDSDKKPGVVLEQSPESGSKITEETKVRIYVNSYKEEDSEEDN